MKPAATHKIQMSSLFTIIVFIIIIVYFCKY